MGCGASSKPAGEHVQVLRPGVEVVSAQRRFDEVYKLGQPISSGVGGFTYLATQRASGKVVVVKKPKRNNDLDDYLLLQDKTHPNLVRVFGMFHSEIETFIVMERAGGDLFDAITALHESFGQLSYKFVAGSLQQVLKGMNYLHVEFEQCHNDIKPENIFFERKPTEVGDVPRCMLGDFGCVDKVGRRRDGDPRYHAPECYKAPSQTWFVTDVWSVGVTLFEMLSGGMLVFTDHRNLSGFNAFRDYEKGALYVKLRDALRDPEAEPCWAQIADAGETAVNLCKVMLARDPADRINATDALQHEWFSTLDCPAEAMPSALTAALHKRAACSDLKMELLNFVASKLQGENLDYYQKIFYRFDTDLDGKLSTEEFLALVCSQEVGKTQEEGLELFNKADISNVGFVDFNEFVAVTFTPDALSEDALSEHCKAIFTRLAGNNKKLTKDQLASMFPNKQADALDRTLFEDTERSFGMRAHRVA